jgi:hypothetical protein
MHRLPRFSSSLFLVLLLALSACGGQTAAPISDDTEADSGTTFPRVEATSVEGACAAQSAASCALRDSCTSGFANQITYGSADICVSQLTKSCIANMSAPGTANTIAHIDGCATAYPTEACTAYWDGATVAACQSLKGARADGNGCGVSSQCASGFCRSLPNAECGTCEPTPQPGDSCETSSNCQYGMSCPIVAPALSGVCTLRGGVGDACDGYLPCRGGLACIGSDTSRGVLGTCQVGQQRMGAACNTKTGPGCDGELYLFCSLGTCQEESVVGSGQTCGTLSGVADIQCAAGALCVKPNGSSAGTCVAATADGEACDLVSGPPCLSPAKCVSPDGGTSGTCVFTDPASCG